MADKMNPRFPHFCVIRRISKVDSFTPDDPFAPENLDENGFPIENPHETVVYAGPCRRESSTNIRTFRTGSSSVGQVNYTDFRVSMPGNVDVRRGDTATVEAGNIRDENVTVLSPNPSELRTKLFPDGCTEFFYNIADI